MFGDFEAQRHWLEVTFNLRIGDWYRQTKENDLLYWGLDYPPLTAYVSLFFAWIANISGHPEIITWGASIGKEDTVTRLFMRSTVIVCDIFVYIPSMIMAARLIIQEMKKFKTGKSPTYPQAKEKLADPLAKSQEDENTIGECIFVVSCLVCPGLLLIDHGHFQYNGVCIGLAMAGVSCICTMDLKSSQLFSDILGSILFCLSLNFKQMALYYSPVFFFVLLYRCSQQNTWLRKINYLLVIGATVLLSFGLLWFPFCAFHPGSETCLSSLLHVLQRQFPFNRGIFEDKVANVWYAVSVIVDIRQHFSMSTLVRMSLVGTLTFLSPLCVFLCTRPISVVRFVLTLMISSITFFLFSFQVHEKSILLSAVPATLLLCYDWDLICWFQILSIFTMYPLLKRDNLHIPVMACTMLYIAIAGIYRIICQQNENAITSRNYSVDAKSGTHPIVRSLMQHVITLSYCGMFLLLLCELTIVPPPRYPDLYPALFSIFGAGNFIVLYIYFVIWLWATRDGRVVSVVDFAKKET